MKAASAGRPARGDRLAAALAALLVAIALVRIVATYPILSQTSDEPAHLASGMELLDRGAYTYEVQHPPLARVAAALGPFLKGGHTHGEREQREEGLAILYADGQPMTTLAWARAGILPFFVAAAWVVWTWTRRLAGGGAALVAVLLVTMLPPMLAHAGLATTDCAVAAFVPAGIVALAWWLRSPTMLQAAVVGACWSLAFLSKLSAVPFLCASAAAIVGLRAWLGEPRPVRALPPPASALAQAAVAVVVGVALAWACYGFSVSYPLRLGGAIPVPAWEWLQGIEAAREHNSMGHRAYLFGQQSQTGWWYFFPVAIAVKTPIPLLLLASAGAWYSLREAGRRPDWLLATPFATAAAIVLVAMPFNFSIGLRHVLPIYPALAVLGGLGAHALWTARSRPALARALVAGALVWLTLGSVRAHPDYLAYFNALAGDAPERILVDSDLDWGQDFTRLVAEVRRRNIDSIAVAYWGSVDLHRQGTPGMRRLQGGERPTGWVAVSEIFRSGLAGPGYDWLQRETPVAHIGAAVSLYYFAPS